jgi:hypothetical protein
VNDISDAVGDYVAGRVRFELTNEILTVLREDYSIHDLAFYRPSMEIASLLLEHCDPQPIRANDPYLWRALWEHYHPKLRGSIGRPAKKILRVARRAIQR